MAVFQRNMNRIDPANPAQSLRAVEEYIRYMRERIEFCFGFTEKGVEEGALSLSGLRAELAELSAALGSAQSAVSALTGQLNTLSGHVDAVDAFVSEHLPIEFQIADGDLYYRPWDSGT